MKRLSTEEWVHRLNTLAAKIEETAASLHPSAWHEQLADLHQAYRELASQPTIDEPEAQQLSLLEDF